MLAGTPKVYQKEVSVQVHQNTIFEEIISRNGVEPNTKSCTHLPQLFRKVLPTDIRGLQAT